MRERERERERERKLRGADSRLERALTVSPLYSTHIQVNLNIFIAIREDLQRGVLWYTGLLLCTTRNNPSSNATQRNMATTRGRSQKCGRSFKCLDTHLWVSATCRDVQDQQSAPPSSSMNTIFPTANSNSATSHSNCSTTQPRNLNSSHETSAVSTAYRTANQVPSTLPHSKQSLRLPKSPEEWDEANLLLSVITPSVLQATTIEEKNNILTNGIYDIMAGRYGTRNPPRPKKRPRQHDRTLRRVTRLKNEARQALRRVRRQEESVSTIQSLSGNFLSLLREHSKLKRKSSRRLQDKEASIVREECHHNFWRYAKCLLDGDTTSQSTPNFSARAAYSFFSEVYMSSPHQFETPSWMSSPPSPVSDCSMDMSPVSPEELTRVIRKSKSSSAPSPLDRISYTILKRCPSIHPALLDLFNSVIMEGAVQSAWKVAAAKLIPKSSAREDPSSPETSARLPSLCASASCSRAS